MGKKSFAPIIYIALYHALFVCMNKVTEKTLEPTTVHHFPFTFPLFSV